MTEKTEIYSIAKQKGELIQEKVLLTKERGYYAKRVTFSSGTP